MIVGGGTAGCVVAARLSEDPAARVLLLEAGGDDSHPDVQNPVKWPRLLKGELDWGYKTQPLRHCGDRTDCVPRARMLGGCHSHNASAWVRGHRNDFDHWASLGCTGWAWEEIQPVFRRIEDWQGPACELRGTGGPMYVAPPVNPNPISGLRVADASIMPSITTGNTNAPTVMIAERAADLI
ncbi:GMC family oxidoreductase N-terminal domain-containing protein [Aeoliella sp.]|uniref:GMC family oxidoreductase N-terminal domain-containing protein n=1 Tax=Aeoliella sp. TaxID=2795800 RepID=UPI003CCBE05B